MAHAGTWTIVRATLAKAPPDSRRNVFWLFFASGGMIVLQVWDVWGRSGAPATAELLSVAAGVIGMAILGLTVVLTAGGAVAGAAVRTDTDDEQNELTPILQALPPLGFLSGVLISAGIALLLARGLLGLRPARVIVPAAIQVFALHVAWITVRNTTRLLFDHGERRAAQAAKARAELSDARMNVLQARMQPHFLFNALNTIAELVRTDPEAAEATVEDLSAILRASLEHGDATTRPLREELALVRAFVAVEQRRLGPRLQVTWTVAPEALETPVPVLSLQPLVENAIKHGIASRIAAGAVTVHVEQVGDSLRLTVTDDGEGFARGWAEGTGLGNLRQRLHSLYGSRASLVIHPGPGAAVTMTIPRAPG
jgi:signal transduction histidine kinase